MDLNIRQELHATIEKLTHSGTPSLDQELVKKVKTICRTTYEMLMRDLAENHAEVRFSAFQLVNHLFTRSSLFRELLTSDFKRFASLVTGTDTQHPLPPPKDAAARLKKSSLLAIREWNQKFSHGYPKLKLGYNFLKFNKKVDFDQLVSQNEAERRRREEREARQRTILQQRIQEVKQEMMGLRRDIDGCLTELEACFTLLLPRFDLPDIYTTTNDTTTTSQDNTVIIKQDKVRSRRRTVSSGGSFVSLSEGSCSDDSVERECKGNRAGGPNASEEQGDANTSSKPEQSRTFQEGGCTSPAGAKECDAGCWQSSRLIPSSESDSDSEVEWEDVEPAAAEVFGVDMQEHGMAAHSFSVPVQVSRHVEVKETEDNSSILATLHEKKQLLVNHQLPSLNNCLEWMTKAGEVESVRSAIDMKNKVKSALAKYNKLNIVFKDPLPEEKPANRDTETGKDSHRVSAACVTESEWKFGTDVPASVPVADLELDPTTPQAQLAILKKKIAKESPLPSSTEHAQSSRRQEHSSHSRTKARAPVVPFGMDLYHWENSSTSIEPRTLAPVGSLHRFWAQETEVSISKDEQDRLKCRTISFPGQFQPVMKSCRALLPSGKLCPRKDRYKCPFHGTIVPRDEHGNPINNDHRELRQSLLLATDDTIHPPPPLWLDQELQQDIMAAKGVDLKISKGKRGRGKGKTKLKAKFPGLTDLKAQVDTPRKRLERKVLSKQSLKRVAESMNELVTKRYNDKFGNNFNYALKN